MPLGTFFCGFNGLFSQFLEGFYCNELFSRLRLGCVYQRIRRDYGNEYQLHIYFRSPCQSTYGPFFGLSCLREAYCRGTGWPLFIVYYEAPAPSEYSLEPPIEGSAHGISHGVLVFISSYPGDPNGFFNITSERSGSC